MIERVLLAVHYMILDDKVTYICGMVFWVFAFKVKDTVTKNGRLFSYQ